MSIDPVFIQQLNGDVRIDDRGEGPLLKIDFFAEFARMFSDEEKYEVLEAATETLTGFLRERESSEEVPEEVEVPRRREAILAQRARNSG